MTKLLNKFTRKLTKRECLHVLQKVWGYYREYDEFEGEERKEEQDEDARWVQGLIDSTFGEGNTDIASVDAHMFGDMEGWTFKVVADTFNYLYKKGILM